MRERLGERDVKINNQRSRRNAETTYPRAPHSPVCPGCLRFRSSRSAESARGLVTATATATTLRRKFDTDAGSVLFLLKRR
ncbi:hypothetical protein MHYP_G00236570 [Metynnis hypsauchen]